MADTQQKIRSKTIREKFADVPVFGEIGRGNMIGDIVALAASPNFRPAIDRNGTAIPLHEPLPRMTSDRCSHIEMMLRWTPKCVIPPLALHSGDLAPDFHLQGTNGRALSLAGLRGQAFVLRFTRVVSTATICPACVPGLEDLKQSHIEFAKREIELIVVVSTGDKEAHHMVQNLEMPYPLYWGGDDYEIFDAYGMGYYGPPMQGWAFVDANGKIVRVWQYQLESPTVIEKGADIFKAVAMPIDILEEIDRVLAK